MAKWQGVCTGCGRPWQAEGVNKGIGPPYMNCPLCGTLFMLIPAPDSKPLKFGDLAKNTQTITELTERKWPMWFKNFGENAEAIRKGANMKDIPKRKGPAIIVGAGPSIHRYSHLKLLAKYRDRIPTLYATDKMLKPLIEAGATPDFVGTVDGDKIISQFYNLDAPAKVDAVMSAVTIHPETRKMAEKNLTGKIYWFVHFVDNPLEERCQHCRRLSTTAGFHFLSEEKLMTQASGNTGAFGWHLAQFLECDPIILVGMDYGYPADIPIEKTLYWDSYVALTGSPENAKACYDTRKNPYFGNEYHVDLIFEVYRGVLMQFVKTASVKTVNATGGGSLHEDPIISMNLEDALKKYCEAG
jgi:hypothetical protein